MAAGFGHPKNIGTTETVELTTSRLVGFLAKGTGTLTLQIRQNDGTPLTVIDAVAVADGEFLDIPMLVSGNILIATTAAAAEGVLFIK